MTDRLSSCDGRLYTAGMDSDEIRQALERFDATLRQVELQAGHGLDQDCERQLDAHRRVLAHLLGTDVTMRVTEAVVAAKHALHSDSPAAELREIDVVRHSIRRILARQGVALPG